MKAATKTHPLIGKFFHSFKNGEIRWQGQVQAVVDPGFYLCQLFEWVIGEESCCLIVPVEQMVEEKFAFYDNQDYWRMEGERLSKVSNEQRKIELGEPVKN